ncbi:MAG: SCO family protein [Rickettsiaceae bacterium]
MAKSNKTSSTVTRVIIILSSVIAILSLYILFTNDLADKPLAGQGSHITGDALIGGDFVLTDQDNNKFSSEAMKGRLSLVYFGFTFCPDICPTSLQKLGAVITTLDKYNIDVLPIFITVDPQRDTSGLLKEYLGHFHGKIIGLTGDEESIKEVADLYKVFYAVAENHDKAQDKYMLDHSSFIYLMNKDGKYVKHFSMDSSAEDIINYIRIKNSQ